MTTLAMFITVKVITIVSPDKVPVVREEDKHIPIKEKLSTFKLLVPIVLLFGLIIGGSFYGWFSHTVGGAIASMVIVIYALAKRIKVKDILMFEIYFSDIDDILCKLGDVFYFANDGGDLYFYKPVFAGDHLKIYREFRDFQDVTNPDGSIYRRFLLTGASNMYNQNGELVARGEGSGRNAIVKFDDDGPVPDDYEQCFEWVDYAPKTHITTDEEWEQVRTMWDNEVIRGADTLYWDDVKIGDMPVPVCSGPISGMDLVRLHGAAYIKLPSIREILESGGELMKDPLGMYQQFTARHYCGCNLPGNHAVFYNFTARDFITRMVTNWMGDDGFITHIGWRFQNLYECMTHNEPGKEILAKVPFMSGKYVNRHGVEGDTAICKGYVTDKYIADDGSACVDLSCWAETFDGDVIQVVQITVTLPKR